MRNYFSISNKLLKDTDLIRFWHQYTLTFWQDRNLSNERIDLKALKRSEEERRNLIIICPSIPGQSSSGLRGLRGGRRRGLWAPSLIVNTSDSSNWGWWHSNCVTSSYFQLPTCCTQTEGEERNWKGNNFPVRFLQTFLLSSVPVWLWQNSSNVDAMIFLGRVSQ